MSAMVLVCVVTICLQKETSPYKTTHECYETSLGLNTCISISITNTHYYG